jgi:hypothetical protein
MGNVEWSGVNTLEDALQKVDGVKENREEQKEEIRIMIRRRTEDQKKE